MALNLIKKAQEVSTLSKLMIGREKYDLEKLINSFPQGVHINAIEFITLDDQEVIVFTVQEKPQEFMFGGVCVKDLFKKLLKEVDGDYEELYASVEEYPIPVKLYRDKTKDGKRDITKIEVLDE